MTPNFQIWYLMSMDMSLCGAGEGEEDGQMPEGGTLATPLHIAGLGRVVPSSPGKQPWLGLRLALVVGCDLQCGQIHAQQLSDPLPPIDVPMLVQNLYRRVWGCENMAGVGESHGQHGAFWDILNSGEQLGVHFSGEKGQSFI